MLESETNESQTLGLQINLDKSKHGVIKEKSQLRLKEQNNVEKYRRQSEDPG